MQADVSLAPLESFRSECFRVLAHPSNAYRFRGLGPLSSLASIDQALSDCAFSAAFVDSSNGEFLGFAQVGLVNYRHGTAQLMACLAPEHQDSAWPLLGVRDFILEAFRTLPIRKLCAEVNGSNRRRFGSGLEHFFRHEGTLRRHEWHRGDLVDVSFYALFREELTGTFWESRNSLDASDSVSVAIRSVIEDVVGCKISDLPTDGNLLELGVLDSLDLLQIVHEISALLDRDIPREVIAECAFASGLEHWIGVFEGQQDGQRQSSA